MTDNGNGEQIQIGQAGKHKKTGLARIHHLNKMAGVHAHTANPHRQYQPHQTTVIQFVQLQGE
jgi:hypothetical protein